MTYDKIIENRVELIKSIVSKEMGITEDICIKSRQREFVDARHILCYALKQIFPKMSLTQLANYSGKRDHASAINSLKIVCDLIITDKMIRKVVTNVMNQCNKMYIDDDKIFKLDMAINVIDEFLKTGKYNAVSTIKEVKGRWYCLCTDDYIWNDDTTIGKIISYYTDKGIVIRYISNYLAFHESNFI